MPRLRLLAIGFTALLFTFFPLVTQAFDARCFTESQCKNQNGFASDEGNIKEFFYVKTDAQIACGVANNGGKNAAQEAVGFCLAAGQATNKIAIGGRRTFSDIGQFIKYGYEYGMWIAGILATTMIVIAGFQWLTSGGNSDAIGSAKKKIAGAITGLLLLSLSYIILNTINPYLTELRLPKTWMINTIQMAAPFCSEVENASLAYLGPDGVTISDEEKNKKFDEAESNGYPIDLNLILSNNSASTTPETIPTCAHRYLVSGAGGQSCLGNFCAPTGAFPRSCLPFDIENAGQAVMQKDVKQNSACWRGSLIIRYTVGDILQGLINKSTKNLAGPIEQSDDDFWLQDKTWSSGQSKKIKLALVCKNLEYNTYKMAPALLETVQLVPITQILNPNGYDQFIIQYYGDAADGSGTLENMIAPTMADGPSIKNTCGLENENVAAHTAIVGFFVVNKINDNYDSDDGIIFIGQNKPSGEATAYIHPFVREDDGDGYSMKFLSYSNANDPETSPQPTWIQNYIPIESVTKGKALFLDFTLTSDIVNALNN